MADIDVRATPPSHSPDVRTEPSAFEQLITNKPPILESLIAQLPTESILALYHTSHHLNSFFKRSPTSWRYISWRLHQPALQTATPPNNALASGARQSSNYALDQLLLYVINPFSTRLTSLELDNTAVSGATLFQSVMVLRKDTLEHVSVRGCKNVSLKYHINPWLTMHAMALDRPSGERAPGYERLALKSLYTYRCRHHRRRPYLPSSLTKKESDSEPTHELVLTCYKLGIWTDTAWCTTPGARCFRRRGYVTMRVPQDPREVWVVFDRLWRSRNWLGPVPATRQQPIPSKHPSRKRKRDCRSWEVEEEAVNGEPIGLNGQGKDVPAHLRRTHKQFVEEIYCDNCSDPILERCEQCSVLMHCAGCRKTLCASCAFDRPYLRNRNALEEDKNKFWWAPGCAVSPCAMQDQDSPPPGPAGNLAHGQASGPAPTIRFKWCCTEPVFSGGGGITYGSGTTREIDRIRAAPLKMGHGWEDSEFSSNQDISCSSSTHDEVTGPIGSPLSRADALHGPGGGRWPSIDSLFHSDPTLNSDQSPTSVPRILCDECYGSEQWKIRCKACTAALCLRHDVKDRMKVRICGYKDLVVERAEYKSRLKALKLLTAIMLKRRKGKLKAAEDKAAAEQEAALKEVVSKNLGGTLGKAENCLVTDAENGLHTSRQASLPEDSFPASAPDPEQHAAQPGWPTNDPESIARPLSPSSNSTGPTSRASSPTPSARSLPATPEPNSAPRRPDRPDTSYPLWKGCQSFFCPPNRTPGDHRRRCIANIRQCADCKIHVCELCVSTLAAPCPCRGCRAPNDNGTPADTTTEENPRFFCPNCRWTRRKNGKCKRKIVETLPNKRSKKNPQRYRKPVEQRHSHLRSSISASTDPIDDSALESLTDFMNLLDMTDRPAETRPLEQPQNMDTPANIMALALLPGPPHDTLDEMRQLEDMGQLARDLIRRIQVLRRQFGPGSLAALALPNITVQDSATNATRRLTQAAMTNSSRGATARAVRAVRAVQAVSNVIEVDEEYIVVPGQNEVDAEIEPDGVIADLNAGQQADGDVDGADDEQHENSNATHD